MSHAAVFRPLQARFLTIPQAPFCYWLRDRFMDLLNTTPIGSVATFTDGVAVRTRFLRFAWEVPEGSRRMPYAKGGQYGRWTGEDRFSYEWESSGARIRTWVVGRYPADKLTLLIKSHDIDVPWVSWSDVARASIGCRLVGPGYLIAHTGPAARAAAERLAGVVDELKAFEAVLDTVSTQGFLSKRLGAPHS